MRKKEKEEKKENSLERRKGKEKETWHANVTRERDVRSIVFRKYARKISCPRF